MKTLSVHLSPAEPIPEGSSVVFEFTRRGKILEGFILHAHGAYHAYLNQCRHIPIALDMGDADFYWDKADRIICKTHGARYAVESGYCDAGPCKGAKLEKFELISQPNGFLLNIPDCDDQDRFIGIKEIP